MSAKKAKKKAPAAKKKGAKKKGAKKKGAKKKGAKKKAAKKKAAKKKAAKKKAPAAKKKAAKKRASKGTVLFVPEPEAALPEVELRGPRGVQAWACAGGGPTRAAASREVLEPPLEVVWRAELDAAPGAGPVVSPDGVVYVPDTEGALYALDAATGERQTVLRTAWIGEGSPVFPLVEQGLVARDRVPISAAPAIAGWQLLYGDDEGVFYAARRGESSETLWRKGISLSPAARAGRAYQAPLVVEGTVFTADAEGTLHAADARNGTAQFALYLRGRPAAAPALSPRHAPPRLLAAVHPLFGGEAPALHAIEPFRGERCWRRDLPGSPRRGLLAHRRGAVVAGDFGLACYALRDGEPRWQVTAEALGGPVEAPLCADRDRLFAATAAGEVVAVDLRAGEVEWTRPAGLTSPISGLACAADVVWLTAGRSLVALLCETGKVEGRVRLPGTAIEGPALALGRLYVSLAAGALVALAPKGAAER